MRKIILFIACVFVLVYSFAGCTKKNPAAPAVDLTATAQAQLTQAAMSRTPTPTKTRTPNQTATETGTQTTTGTFTASITLSTTLSATATDTFSSTATRTITRTITATFTATPTPTLTRVISMGMSVQYSDVLGSIRRMISISVYFESTPCAVATVYYTNSVDVAPPLYISYDAAAKGYHIDTDAGDTVPVLSSNSLAEARVHAENQDFTLAVNMPYEPTVTANGLGISVPSLPDNFMICVSDSSFVQLFCVTPVTNSYVIDKASLPGPGNYTVHLEQQNIGNYYGSYSTVAERIKRYNLFVPSATITPTYTQTPVTNTYRQGLVGYTGTSDGTISSLQTTYNYGACPDIGAGRSATETGRGLIKFNLTSLAGKTIVSASLTLYVSIGVTGSGNLALVELSRAFSEGEVCSAASAGDATWVSAGITSWTTPGGDFAGAVSNNRPFTTATSEVVFTLNSSIVQGWVDDSASNDGMLLKLVSETTGNSIYFGSAENLSAVLRPTLVVRVY
jgi:hypothetical protein